MAQVVQLLGFVAAIIVALGYLPQIIHLLREHCSAGISLQAWLVWVVASILFYSHALSIRDPVFIVLLTVQLTAQITIFSLAKRYQGMACGLHGGHGDAHKH